MFRESTISKVTLNNLILTTMAKKGNAHSHILKASPKKQAWEKKVKSHSLGIMTTKEKKSSLLDKHPFQT
jgi:hypothetical protein